MSDRTLSEDAGNVSILSERILLLGGMDVRFLFPGLLEDPAVKGKVFPLICPQEISRFQTTATATMNSG